MSTLQSNPPAYLIKTYNALLTYVDYNMSKNAAITDEFTQTIQTMLNDAIPKTEIERVQASMLRALASINKIEFSNLLKNSKFEPWLLWASIGGVIHKLGLLGKIEIRQTDTGYIVVASKNPRTFATGGIDEVALHNEIMSQQHQHQQRGRGRVRGQGRGRGRGGRGRFMKPTYVPREDDDVKVDEPKLSLTDESKKQSTGDESISARELTSTEPKSQVMIGEETGDKYIVVNDNVKDKYYSVTEPSGQETEATVDEVPKPSEKLKHTKSSKQKKHKTKKTKASSDEHDSDDDVIESPAVRK